MANEAASVASEEAPPSASEPTLADPPQLPKADPAQKGLKEPTKPQTPLGSMDANKGDAVCVSIQAMFQYQHQTNALLALNNDLLASMDTKTVTVTPIVFTKVTEVSQYAVTWV